MASGRGQHLSFLLYFLSVYFFLGCTHARAPRLFERACTLFYSRSSALLWALAGVDNLVVGLRWTMGDGRCIFSTTLDFLSFPGARMHTVSSVSVVVHATPFALLCGCGRSSHSVGECVHVHMHVCARDAHFPTSFSPVLNQPVGTLITGIGSRIRII
jgi:hypothetical protein